MGNIEDYLKSKERKRYYCLSCFQHSKERHYLQILEDETGKAYRCPNCKHMSADWVIEKHFDESEKEIFEKMGIF